MASVGATAFYGAYRAVFLVFLIIFLLTYTYHLLKPEQKIHAR